MQTETTSTKYHTVYTNQSHDFEENSDSMNNRVKSTKMIHNTDSETEQSPVDANVRRTEVNSNLREEIDRLKEENGHLNEVDGNLREDNLKEVNGNLKETTERSTDDLTEESTDQSSDEYQSNLFKLPVDCFFEIFEYLSVKDLHSLGQTCTTMQQVAGVYFQRNYFAAEKFCAKDGVHTMYSNRDGDVNERIPTSYFNQYMPCISHYYGVIGPIRYLQSHVNEFTSTNHIYLVSLFINHEKIKLIKELLPQIETMQIRNCSMSRNFYELMLKYCKNLKNIYVQNADSSFNGQHDWLLEYYPMLEHLELMPSYPIVVPELDTFFKRNTNVQRFSTSARFLWINRSQFLESNVKLQILEIKAEYFTEYDEMGNKISVWDLLNQLYETGFYKKLFIFTDRIDQDLSCKLTSVSHCLETLCMRSFEKIYSLPYLVNLKELIILKKANANDMKILAKNLVKLQRLYVEKATIEDILPFIQQSPGLNKIKLFIKGPNECLYENDEDDNNPAYKFWYYEEDAELEKNENAMKIDAVQEKPTTDWRILNLAALNREREKLRVKYPTTRKVTIYVRDDVFLATKWATRNGDINLSLIEMRRSDSYEWNHHF